MADQGPKHPWWSIDGAELLDMLRRVANGEDPDAVYLEAYASAYKDPERE